MPSHLAALALLALTLNPLAGLAQGQAVWQDDFQSRLEVYALMQSLSVDILGSSSATRSLEQWCATYHLAAVPKITAQRIAGEDKPATAEQLRHLEVADAAELKYRKVRLTCGGQVLSEADNWYVPARLDAEMNRLLDTTDTPFGKIVAPLQPYRQTLSVKLLWSPLPQDWALSGHGRAKPPKTHALDIPAALFEHQAVLYGKERKPIAEVHETYQRAILAVPGLPNR